jgi:hypothetical protein
MVNQNSATNDPNSGLSAVELEAELVSELPVREEMSGFNRWFRPEHFRFHDYYCYDYDYDCYDYCYFH